MSMDIEASLIYQKNIKLRCLDSALVDAAVNVFESNDPYILIFVVILNDSHTMRMNVDKEKLSEELKRWIGGALVKKPCFVLTKSAEDNMIKFIKLGKTPTQKDLIMWVLSRTEIRLGSDASIKFGGFHDNYTSEVTNSLELSSSFSSTARASLLPRKQSNTMDQLSSLNNTKEVLETSLRRTRPSSAPSAGRDMTSTYELSKAILGSSSAALGSLKQATLSSREGSRVVSLKNTSEKFILGANIERSRKEIEAKLEERRKVIEVSKARKEQTKERLRTIRDNINEKKNGETWTAMAMEELIKLQQIQKDIETDILKQKSRAIREQHLIHWTQAPAGFSNLRGKSIPGIVIGPGPLPESATTSERDPRIERTIKKFYWDESGRRHLQRHDITSPSSNPCLASLIHQCMEAIQRQAQTNSLYRMNLKKIFEQFDTSGDGFLTQREMADAFLSMGIEVDVETIKAIFKLFDANGSGSVHYGEFLWSFFNRRKFLREYTQINHAWTPTQQLSLFHQHDIDGNGYLSRSEFLKFMKKLGYRLSDMEAQLLMDRFDEDGSGDIDFREFQRFLQQEFPEGKGTMNATSKSNGVAGKVDENSRKDPLRGAKEHPPHWKSKTMPSNSTTTTSRVSKEAQDPSWKSRTTTTSSSTTTTAQTPKGVKNLHHTNRPSSATISTITSTTTMPQSSHPSSFTVGKVRTPITDASVVESYSEPSKVNGISAIAMSQIVDLLDAQAQLEATLGKKYYR